MIWELAALKQKIYINFIDEILPNNNIILA